MKNDLFSEPRKTLRDQQKDRTRARIVAMAGVLIAEEGEDAVTIGAVAAAVGVAERTVFRHFRTREQLLDAGWEWAAGQYGPPPPAKPGALVKNARVRFKALAQERPVVRAFLQSQLRPNGPNRRVDRQREAALIRRVQIDMQGLDVDVLRRRAAIVDLLSSPYALEFLQQYWGFDGGDAGEAAAEAIKILLNRAPA